MATVSPNLNSKPTPTKAITSITPSPHGPFTLDPTIENPLRRALFTASKPMINQTLALHQLNGIYHAIQASPGDGSFCAKALDTLNVSFRVPTEQLARIPKTGPLVIVANHPFGGLEGLILPTLLEKIRPDAKLLANYMLNMIPDLRDQMFFVDPFGGSEAARRNLSSVRSAIHHVRNGGVLGVFPAGAVSHLHVRQRSICDPPWNDTIARIVIKTGAPVVPVFFEGRNSDLFQIMGMIHPRLRTMMLPRELLKKQHSHVSLRIGSPIAPARLKNLSGAAAMTDYLRVRTYLLKSAESPSASPASSTTNETHDATDTAIPDSKKNKHARKLARHELPVIDPVPVEKLRHDIDALPAEQTLLHAGDRVVMFGRAPQLPHILREIGRLRELSFRLVGEGTGQALDLDIFDQTYLQLFVWDRHCEQIIGAYRLGPTDEILPIAGKRGLYTSTLFRFKTKLLEQIGPALEMGRSFVHPDHQKSFAPLLLLWKGIGHFVARYPRYRKLFGPVSISNQYSSVSKQLLLAFLRMNRYLPDLGKLLRPKNPPRFRSEQQIGHKQANVVVGSIDEVNELLADLESDGKMMPVLLRQYLKLNARVLGFNIDPDFGDVLDGLVLVDLTTVDRKVLTRYMGVDNTAAFYDYHGVNPR